jgi:hypothetical protein
VIDPRPTGKLLAVVASVMLLGAGMGSSALVARAFAQSHHVSAIQKEKRIGPKPTPSWYWRWVPWRLGEGYAKGHALQHSLRPRRAPHRVPHWAWQKLHFFLLARVEATAARAGPGAVTTPRPPKASIKGYYDQGANNVSDWNAYKRYGFNLVFAPVGDTTLLHQVKADGASAWVQPNIWTGCGYRHSRSQALSYARTAVATGAVSGFYVADEPSVSGCSSAPSQIASWTATLHANFPGIPTIIAAYDSTELTDFAHSADEFALDTYPCQYGNGCNYSWITSLAAKADRLGLKYVGVAQAFGGDGHFDLPTASQLKQIIKTWKSTHELGYVVYAFSAAGMPSSDWLQRHSGLLSTIATN